MNRSCLRALCSAPLALLLLIATPAAAQPVLAPVMTVKVTPAVDGVFDAFASHPIVALGDRHGLAQELDFYAALVRDPRFALEVGYLVVEFGSATHQDTLNRYLSGEIVPYADLRKVWTDSVAGVWSYLGYMNLLAQVRATNVALPAEKKIRVLLGDPPIDWSKITALDDLAPYELQRDSYPAELIRREILARGRKALVIYGPAHLPRERDGYIKGAVADPRSEAALRAYFHDLATGAPDYSTMTPEWAGITRRLTPQWKLEVESYGALKSQTFLGKTYAGDMFILDFTKTRVKAGFRLNKNGKIEGAGFERMAADEPRSIVDRVEDGYPGSVFFVTPYVGFADKGCTERFERVRTDWTAPALLQPVRGTALAADLTAEGCSGAGRDATADGLLYLGPASTLTVGPEHPDIYLDEAYRKEANRRSLIMTGKPLPSPVDMLDHRSGPVKLRP